MQERGKNMHMKTIVKSLDHQSDPYQIRLPQSVYTRVKRDEPLQFTFGQHSVFVRVHAGKDVLEISEHIASELFIPFEERPFLLQYNLEKKEIKLGPVIALLASKSNQLSPYEPFGAMTSFFKELARYCIQKGIFFYVIPLQSKHHESHILGYRWTMKQWVKGAMPLPDVIYNRISSRKLEKSDEANMLFTRFRNQRIPIFNERFLNKWEIFNALQHEPVLIPHLPKTVLYQKASDLDAMLQKYTVIFAKPITGSLGRGIVKITHENGKYTLHFSNQSSEHHVQFNLLHLLRNVIPILKRQPYILQQGIKSLTYNGQPTDFRILCNKDRTGVWKVTSIVGRRSANERFVSNVAMGGSLHRPKQILSSSFNQHESHAILNLLVELSLHCVKTIEQQLDGTFGEFGIDLMIDEFGKPWILEMNTKPSKTEESNIVENGHKIKRSTKALIQFAASLAGFEIH